VGAVPKRVSERAREKEEVRRTPVDLEGTVLLDEDIRDDVLLENLLESLGDQRDLFLCV
jgi:hypothetical protein